MDPTTIPPPPPGFQILPQTIPPPPQGFEMVSSERPQTSGGWTPPAQGQPWYEGDTGQIGTLDALSRLASQSLSFNTSDEIAAGIQTGGGLWGDYDRTLAEERELVRRAREQYPWSATTADIAGPVAIAIGTGGLGAPQTLGGRVGLGAVEGGLMGGAYGFGGGEGATDRLGDAATGGAFGAVTGAAAPLAMEAGRQGINAASRFVTSRSIPKADRVLAETMTSEGFSPAQLQQMSSALPEEGMLLDVTPGMRLEADRLVSSGRPGSSELVNALRQRSQAAPDRIAGLYDDAMGQVPNVAQRLDDIAASRKAVADPMYARAREMARPVNTSKVLESIDEALYPSPELAGKGGPARDALDKELIWLRGRLSGKEGTQVTDIKVLDNLQRDLRLKAEDYARQGQNRIAGRLKDLRGMLLEQLDASSVDSSGQSIYKAARQQFSDDSAVQEAFDLGRSILKGGDDVHPDFLEQSVAGMSTAEKDALKEGARAAMADVVGKARVGSRQSRSIETPLIEYNERNLRTILGDAEADKIIRGAEGSRAMMESERQILGNSSTARRMMNNRYKEGGDIPAGLQGGMTSAVYAGARGVARALSNASTSKLSQEVSRRLTTEGPQRDALVKALLAASKKMQSAPQVGPIPTPLIKALTGALIGAREGQ